MYVTARLEAPLRVLADAIPEMAAYLDRELRFAFVNARWTEWFGLPAAAFEDRPIAEFPALAAIASFVGPASTTATGLETRSSATVLAGPNGTPVPVTVSVHPNSAAGAVEGFAVIIQRTAEPDPVLLSNALPQIIWIGDAQGRTEFANDYWYEYTGATRERELRDIWFDAVHGDDMQNGIDAWVAGLAAAAPFAFEFRLRSAARAEWRWHLATVRPLRDASGAVRNWFGTAIDIHDRRAAEDEIGKLNRDLARRLHELELILQVTPVGILIASDPQCREIRANPAFSEWVGAGPQENISHTGPNSGRLRYRVMRNGRGLEAGELPLQTAAREGRQVEAEVDLVRDDGATVNVYGYASPLFDEDGKTRGSIGAFVDVSERKRMEQALRASNAILRRANEDLKQFAYAASHDLREPLRMVGLYAELLVRKHSDRLTPEAREFAGFIAEGATRMQSLLNDLLAFTRAGGETVTDGDLERVDCNAVLAAVLQNLSAAIEESGATVTSEPLPVVAAHRVHVVQVLQNLIANAIKYRKPGTAPAIHVSAEPGGEGMELLRVRDNGIGIKPLYHQRIFGLFKRLHKTDYPGTGIGLAICQRLVERYGGRIWVESEEGYGAQFCFTLPSAEAAHVATNGHE